MLSSLAVLLLASALFAINGLISFKRSLVKDISTLADLIGINAIVPLSFNRQDSAEELLAALKKNTNIISAHIISTDGSIFAHYLNNLNEHKPDIIQLDSKRKNHILEHIKTGTENYHFSSWDYLDMNKLIVFEGEIIGMICIRADIKQSLITRMKRYLTIFGFIILTVLFAAFILSSQLQKVISRPILKMVGIMRIVSEEKDYSIRAEKQSDDEIGYLIDRFNEMLEQIQKNDELLEGRVEERTMQLVASLKELEAYSYSVSHDLRTPLRGIDGFSQILLDDYSDRLDDQGRHYLQRIRKGSQRMARLIDDMLNLSRLTRSEMCHEQVNLSDIAQKIVSDLQATDPSRQAQFTIAPELIVEGDPRLLRQMLENLLGNAWKFTSKRSQAAIEFGITEQDGEPAYFVRDNGAGFDMEYVGKLFTAFQRLHAVDEYEGTGIGLATVQRVIRRHGGLVWAEGEVDRGATFYFTIKSH